VTLIEHKAADDTLLLSVAYVYLLPQDVVAGGPAGLWPHFPRVLEQHPHLLRRLRRLPR
jgi:hypothetical protein